ncbi:MAG TPA: contractile injection system protein, VgrG/Pvc8 family, partial [Rhodocyclaceae bacterium]|nr:contractile injection system protein, VgrG/Pvc8 family [Rhodocyclaceae bacterium]
CTIAGECDLEPSIAKKLADEAIEHLDQTNESGANLLTRLARQFDAIATVKSGKLIFMGAAGAVSASGKALPTVTIQREDGDQHRFSIADREIYTAVRATYNDLHAGEKGEVVWGKDEDSAERNIPPKVATATATGQYKDAGKTFKSRASAEKAARKQWFAMKGNKAARAAWVGVKAKYDDRNLGVSGEVTYGQANEEKQRAQAQRLAAKDAGQTSQPGAIDHSADNTKTMRHVYASKENAKRAARAEWRRLQRGMATFSITLARGRPDLFPEIPVTVRGYKPQIDSTDWIISKATHNLGDSGLTSTLEFEIKATEIPD